MCRRRLLKSNFYINYGGTKKAHGETVIVSPFVAGGASDTFELYARNPWVITNDLSWLTVSSLSDKSGKYTITITAAKNQTYSERNGTFTAKTLDDRFSIIISVSQQAKVNEKSISISPSSVDMGAKETYSSLICYFTNTGTTTEVVPTWSTNSSAVTVNSNGEIETNNTGGSLTVTVTATYVHEGDTLTDTMTVNVAAAVVTYRNLSVVPLSLVLGSEDISTGKTIQAYVDEYINGVYHEQVDVTFTSDWSSADNSIAEVTGGIYAVVKPVYGSGFFPNERTTTITAVYDGPTTYEGTNEATCNVTVEPQGLVTHYISVEPTGATIGSTGEVQLTVLYHTVTDGVDDGGVDVTTSAGYTDNGSDLIDVNTTGKVNGSGSETGGNATVTVSYPGVESVDVPITVRAATVDYRNFRVIPLSMTLGKDDVTDGKQIQAYVDVFINNVFSEELEVTADASWSSQDTDIASVSKSGANEVVKPVYGAGYFPTERTTKVQASYLESATTCDVTVEPEGYIEQYIEVTPSSVALGATGSKQLEVTLYTKTDGVVDAGVDVTSSCTYESDSQIITVDNGGLVTANNTGDTEVTANITVSYPDVDSVTVPAISSPANIEHELLLEAQGSTTLDFEEECEFTLYYITKINGEEVSREVVTNNITWDPIDEEKGYMEGTTFMNEWYNIDQTTVIVCATYNGIESNDVVLTLNGTPAYYLYFTDSPSITGITVMVDSADTSYSEPISYNYPSLSTDGTGDIASVSYDSVSVTAYFDANPSTSERTVGTVTLTGTGGTGEAITLELEIIQRPKYVYVTSIEVIIDETSVPDIHPSGGSVTCSDIEYTVYAYYSDETYSDVTTWATIDCIGVTADTLCTTATTGRTEVGTLEVSASYDGCTAETSVTVYQGINEYTVTEVTGTTTPVEHSETKTDETSYEIVCDPTTTGITSDGGTFDITVEASANTPTSAITYDTWQNTTTYTSAYTSTCTSSNTVTDSDVQSGSTSVSGYVVTVATPVTIYNQPNWVTASLNDNTCTVTVEANTDTTARDEYIEFKAANDTSSIPNIASCSIEQDAATPSYEFYWENSSTTISVDVSSSSTRTTVIRYHSTYPNTTFGYDEIVTGVTDNGSGIVAHYTANPTTSERTGYVYAKSNGTIIGTMTITQGAVPQVFIWNDTDTTGITTTTFNGHTESYTESYSVTGYSVTNVVLDTNDTGITMTPNGNSVTVSIEGGSPSGHRSASVKVKENDTIIGEWTIVIETNPTLEIINNSSDDIKVTGGTFGEIITISPSSTGYMYLNGLGGASEQFVIDAEENMIGVNECSENIDVGSYPEKVIPITVRNSTNLNSSITIIDG